MKHARSRSAASTPPLVTRPSPSAPRRRSTVARTVTETGDAETHDVMPDTSDRSSGWRARVDAVTERARDGFERLQQARTRSITVDTAFGLAELDADRGGVVLAGALAFRIFLFMVPYVFTVVVGLGIGSDIADANPVDVARATGGAGLIATSVANAADLDSWSRLAAFLVAAYALVWGSRSLVRVLWIGHALVWATSPVKPRKVMRPALILILIVSAGLLAIGLASKLDTKTIKGEVTTLAVLLAFTAGAWLLIGLWLPHRGTWTTLVPGAVGFALGGAALHVATVIWFAHLVGSKSETYGALGASLAMLLWAYFLGRLAIAAALLNAANYRRLTRAASSGLTASE